MFKLCWVFQEMKKKKPVEEKVELSKKQQEQLELIKQEEKVIRDNLKEVSTFYLSIIRDVQLMSLTESEKVTFYTF